jgi:hypothetical protein
LIEARQAVVCCFKWAIGTDLNFRRHVLLAEEVREALIRFQIRLPVDRHGLKSGSAVETRYLGTAQKFQDRVLK